MDYLGTTFTETRARPVMEDVNVVINSFTGKAKLTGVTPKGYEWIKQNMTGISPITIDAEHLPDLEKTLEKAGLTVLSR